MLAASILAGCSTNGQTAVDVVDIATTVEQVVEVEESTTTTAPTTTIPATTTTTTDPNVTPIPGSCLVLEERYCQMITVVTFNGGTLAGFNLPPGTAIFSPYEGRVTRSISESGKFFGILVSKGDIDFEKAENVFAILYTTDEPVKNYIQKGEILARVGEANFEDEDYSAYNLTFGYIKNGYTTATISP